VKAVDGFKKLDNGFENCSTIEEFKFIMNQRVHQCKHEGRVVLVLPAFKLDDDAFVEDNEVVRRSQELKVKEVTKKNVSLFLRLLRGLENEEETCAFLKRLTCDESLHSAVQHTEALDMNVCALTFVDLFNGARIWGNLPKRKIAFANERSAPNNEQFHWRRRGSAIFFMSVHSK